ncbi:hypothetical protein GCM10010353_43340 [Streptomyces chryseus]|nr:hypothetical protein GCM10010353_43340 [Streptomyces chryseus]
MTSPPDKSPDTPPAPASPLVPAPACETSPLPQETRGASGGTERRPYVRLMAALGGMGAAAAVIGMLVGFTTDPAFPLPERMPTMPTRPGMPSGLPTGPGALPSGFPTDFPTEMPTGFPTEMPTGFPTDLPTDIPTGLPDGLPSGFPTEGSIPKSGGSR